MTLALVCLFGVGAKGAVRVMTISGESFSLTAETATGNGSYFYRFQGCNATATYSDASGCTVTFNGKSTITGIRSTKAVKVILDKLAVVEVVPASGESGCSISADGGVEIVGPGRLSILNGRILSSSDIKIAESLVDIVTPDKVRPISTSGTIEIVLSSVSITGYGCLISGMEGVKITASMVSLLSWPTSEGSQYAVIRHGNPQVGKPGGVSITGSVVSIVGRDAETAGILTRRGLLITESCLAIVSGGPCISVVHFQDGGMQYFDHVRLFAVSQNGNAFADGLSGDTNYAYWGDGKYVLNGLKGVFMTNADTQKAAAVLAQPLSEFKKSFDPSELGGSPILGLNKPVIKAHGSSDAKAFFAAIRQAKAFAESGIIEEIKNNIELMKVKAGTDGST